VKTATINLEYQNYIELPPQAKNAAYGQACSNDRVTVEYWRPTWIGNYKANKAKYGTFASKSAGVFFGRHQYLPAVVCGSGPHLAENGPLLKDLDPRIPIVSCLHNFHWHVDNGIRCDYFITLDAGPVTVEEVYEGGKKTEEEYWAASKSYRLIAFAGTCPKLLEKWQGEIYFFNCPIPDQQVMGEMDATEVFHFYVSTGGNVLGAGTYFAKAILGCNPIAFLGASFSFGYGDAQGVHHFHGWDSKYDKNLGEYMLATDVFGVRVKTWRSYQNFKCFFDWLAMTVPGVWINCTEGGTFGATAEGNIRQIVQMPLADFLGMYQMNRQIQAQCENPAIAERRVLY
jgi:hypothetical protein